MSNTSVNATGDIPQDVWDAARYALFGSIPAAAFSALPHKDVVHMGRCARAILTERQRIIGELDSVLNRDLNVTDEELLRIRNQCEKDGDVKIWARMVQKITDAVRRSRSILTRVSG